MQQWSHPDTTLERRFFQTTGVVMVLGTMMSGAIMLRLAANMQTAPAPVKFAVYGHVEGRVVADVHLDTGETLPRARPVILLKDISPKLEAATELQNIH